MTDEREPTTDPTPDPDATGRMSTPATPATLPTEPSSSTTTATPTAPLTPATRASATSPTYEHEVAWASGPVPALPVVPPGVPRRGGRVRWAASLAVVAVVVLASAVVAALITGGSSTATVLGYVPDGTTVYSEVRLDLPGDQRRAIGEFLQKFPGFADQSTIETKIAMLEAHQSQLTWLRDHDGIDVVEQMLTTTRFRGQQCRVEYAEGFVPCLTWLRAAESTLKIAGLGGLTRSSPGT